MIITDLPAPFAKIINRLKDKQEISLLFVCLGNICRSPAAEGLMLEEIKSHPADHRQWIIDSAGTSHYHIGDLPDQRMRIHARRRGVELNHICRHVNDADFFDFDLIFGMDQHNISNLKKMAPTPESEEKVIPISLFFGEYSRFDCVPDPYYDGDDGFERVLNILTYAVRYIYDTITYN